MNNVPRKKYYQDPFRKDLRFQKVPSDQYRHNFQCFDVSSLDALKCYGTIHISLMRQVSSRGGQGTIQANDDPFAVVETYYADARFHGAQPKTNQGKEPPLTGEITIKAETPLHDITKPMTRLECMTMEPIVFQLSSKGSGSYLIFQAISDMDNRSVSKELRQQK